MKYRDRTNGEVFNLFELQQKFPSVSFPVNWDASTYDFANVDPVTEVAPPQPTSIHNRIDYAGVQKIDGIWMETWIEVPKYDDPTQQAEWVTECLEIQWNLIRSQREILLTQTDYTQLPDTPITPENKAAFAAYRQALRDVTTQVDPYNIAWPTPPIYEKE